MLVSTHTGSIHAHLFVFCLVCCVVVFTWNCQVVGRSPAQVGATPWSCCQHPAAPHWDSLFSTNTLSTVTVISLWAPEVTDIPVHSYMSAGLSLCAARRRRRVKMQDLRRLIITYTYRMCSEMKNGLHLYSAFIQSASHSPIDGSEAEPGDRTSNLPVARQRLLPPELLPPRTGHPSYTDGSEVEPGDRTSNLPVARQPLLPPELLKVPRRSGDAQQNVQKNYTIQIRIGRIRISTIFTVFTAKWAAGLRICPRHGGNKRYPNVQSCTIQNVASYTLCDFGRPRRKITSRSKIVAKS